MKKISLFQTAIFITILFLSIVSFIVLPDSVAVQWNTNGASNYIPKIYAVMIPAVISLFGIVSWKYSSVRYNINIESSNKIKNINSVIWIFFSFTGIIINILFMIM
ncbi:MAG: hypothetical protein K2J39_13490, partial [Ruminococcus sp.]|nr:hypothetical protein [Ruminococcus sp.]